MNDNWKTFWYFLGLSLINIPCLIGAVVIVGFNDNGETFNAWSGLLFAIQLTGGIGSFVSVVYIIGYVTGNQRLTYFHRKTFISCWATVLLLMFCWYYYVAVYVY